MGAGARTPVNYTLARMYNTTYMCTYYKVSKEMIINKLCSAFVCRLFSVYVCVQHIVWKAQRLLRGGGRETSVTREKRNGSRCLARAVISEICWQTFGNAGIMLLITTTILAKCIKNPNLKRARKTTKHRTQQAHRSQSHTDCILMNNIYRRGEIFFIITTHRPIC